MQREIVGWDVGGAHLKAALLDGEGRILQVAQVPCALWQGLEQLGRALDEVSANLPAGAGLAHAVTMTGELADCFADRDAGVRALVGAMDRHRPGEPLLIFAGPAGFLAPARIEDRHLSMIASANWLVSTLWIAEQWPAGILIDIGSTTTDLIPFANGQVLARGYTDHERLRYDELVYSGVTRTPLMAIAQQAPFAGEWVGLMNEHFATTADLYRLCGELPDHADQQPAADGGGKEPEACARRLARMLGRDWGSAGLDDWRRLARYFRARQLDRLGQAVERQLSRGLLGTSAVLVGAGVGRFLVGEIARRTGCTCADLPTQFPYSDQPQEFSIADCLPAVAVADLARRRIWPK